MMVKHGCILTMNDRNDIITDGSVYIENDTIIDIGPTRILETEYSDNNELDVSGRIIMPGLINSHVHTGQTLARGIGDDLSLLDWLEKRIIPYESSLTKDESRISSLLGYAEMIKSGITSCVDMQSINHADEAFNSADIIGIRAKIGKTMMDMGEGYPTEILLSTEENIESSLQLFQKWHGKSNERIEYIFSPRFALSCTTELLQEVGNLSEEHGLWIQTHVSENLKEVEIVEERHGMSNIEYLHKVGIIGPKSLLAHCIWVNENDIRILKQQKATVVHNPSSNCKLGSGICNVPEFKNQGVRLSLGSDGAACNNTLDLFTEMRLLSHLQTGIQHDPSIINSTDVFNIVYNGGSRIFNNKIGSLEKGKKADIITVGVNHLHNVPMCNPSSNIIYSTHPTDVQDVIIDGKLIMENRKMLTIDENILIKEGQNKGKEIQLRILESLC